MPEIREAKGVLVPVQIIQDASRAAGHIIGPRSLLLGFVIGRNWRDFQHPDGRFNAQALTDFLAVYFDARGDEPINEAPHE